MIDADELKQASRLSGLRLKQQEKSYIQLAILRSIYSKLSKELVFKGGTCLFFTANLNRFSEDLDFTLNGSTDLDAITSGIVSDLNYLGIASVGKKVSDDEVGLGFRIESQGPLFSGPKTAVYTRVDISKRADIFMQVQAKSIRSTYSDLPEFSLATLDISETFAEKIRAIYSRKQARDVYDLYFLIKKGVKSSTEIINKKLALYRLSFSEDSFREKLSEKRDVWHAELDPLIVGALPEFDVVFEKVMDELPRFLSST